jgi:hypothetical protein
MKTASLSFFGSWLFLLERRRRVSDYREAIRSTTHVTGVRRLWATTQ